MIDIRELVGAILLLVQGISELLKGSMDGIEFEEGIRQLVHSVSVQVYEWSLQRLDEKLMKDRDRQRWEVVGFRTRRLVTVMGEVTVRRRLYRDRDTGDTRFLLDYHLGIEKGKRLSPLMRKWGVEFSAKMSFREAAATLEKLAPHVSPMTVWNEAQEAGELARRDSEVRVAATFDEGEVPQGDRVSETLYVEADGVHIKQQGVDKKSEEVKLAAIYEGKEKLPSGKKKLQHRQAVGGVMSGAQLWEHVSERSARVWDLTSVQQVKIGGDGADWIKKGTEAFPGSDYHLDEYHLRRALTRALSFDSAHYHRVSAAIEELDLEEVQRGLDAAIKSSRGKKRQKIEGLKRYVMNNWEGIENLSEEARMGVIEAQVRHIISRRMKHIGGRWSPSGTDNMAYLLAADANDELGGYVAVRAWHRDKLDELLEDAEPVRDIDTADSRRPSGPDLQDWLRASLPALEGPHAGRMWIKHVLREIAKAAPKTGAA